MSATANYPLPSADASHHIDADGKPAYDARYIEVGKFHAPGLAPVRAVNGWCHIGQDGEPIYRDRFEKVWGFYCHRAAAKEPAGWTHLEPSGARAYVQRYPWVGNFQDDLCSVQTVDGFHHILADGTRAYSANFAYAGDFRDGAAVVISQIDGLSRHITPSGKLIHDKAFMELDVFHKGFARARDASGWFHIKADGQACYASRFMFIEPFYNDYAVAHTQDGNMVRISHDGQIIDHLAVLQAETPGRHEQSEKRASGSAVKVLITGNIGSGKSTLAARIAQHLGWSHESIDRYRQLHSDGSPSGEASAWSHFLSHAQSSSHSIYECTGAGPHRHLLSKALSLSRAKVVRVAMQTAHATCSRRAHGKRWDTPYPFDDIPDAAMLEKIEAELTVIWADGDYLPISETDSPQQALSKFLHFISDESP